MSDRSSGDWQKAESVHGDPASFSPKVSRNEQHNKWFDYQFSNQQRFDVANSPCCSSQMQRAFLQLTSAAAHTQTSTMDAPPHTHSGERRWAGVHKTTSLSLQKMTLEQSVPARWLGSRHSAPPAPLNLLSQTSPASISELRSMAASRCRASSPLRGVSHPDEHILPLSDLQPHQIFRIGSALPT